MKWEQSLARTITQWILMSLYAFFGATSFIWAWYGAAPLLFVDVSVGITGAFMLCEAGILASKLLSHE